MARRRSPALERKPGKGRHCPAPRLGHVVGDRPGSSFVGFIPLLGGLAIEVCPRDWEPYEATSAKRHFHGRASGRSGHPTGMRGNLTRMGYRRARA